MAQQRGTPTPQIKPKIVVEIVDDQGNVISTKPVGTPIGLEGTLSNIDALRDIGRTRVQIPQPATPGRGRGGGPPQQAAGPGGRGGGPADPFSETSLANVMTGQLQTDEAIRQGQDLLSTPLNVLSPGMTQEGLTPLQRTAAVGGDLAALVTGIRTPGLIPRMIKTAAYGGGAELATGGDPLSRGILEAGSELASDKFSRLIPKAGYYAGAKIGGLRGDVSKLVDSLMNERFRNAGTGSIVKRESFVKPGQGLLLGGSETKVADRIKEAAAARSAEAAAIPHTYRVGGLFGSTKGAARDAQEGVQGLTTAHELKSREQGVLREIAKGLNLRRSGKPFEDMGLPTQRKVLKKVPKENIGSAMMTPVSATEGLAMQSRLGQDAHKVFEARQKGEQFQPKDDPDAAVAHGLWERNRDLMENIFPTLNQHNARLTDLYNIKEATSHLRRRGSLLGTPGEMAAAGGLGYGVAGNLANLAGLDRLNPIRGAAGPLSIPLLSSKGMSFMGNVGGSAAEMSPHLIRLYHLLRDLTFDPKEPQ